MKSIKELLAKHEISNNDIAEKFDLTASIASILINNEDTSNKIQKYIELLENYSIRQKEIADRFNLSKSVVSILISHKYTSYKIRQYLEGLK